MERHRKPDRNGSDRSCEEDNADDESEPETRKRHPNRGLQEEAHSGRGDGGESESLDDGYDPHEHPARSESDMSNTARPPR